MSDLIIALDIELAKLRRQNALVIVEGVSRADCAIADAEGVAKEFSRVIAECDAEIDRLYGLLDRLQERE